jgi:hypothetical protein
LDELIKNFGTEGDEYYLVDASNQKIFLGSDKKKEFKEALPIFPSLSKLQAAGKPTSLVFSDQLDKTEKLFAYAKFGKLEGCPIWTGKSSLLRQHRSPLHHKDNYCCW